MQLGLSDSLNWSSMVLMILNNFKIHEKTKYTRIDNAYNPQGFSVFVFVIFVLLVLECIFFFVHQNNFLKNNV